MGVALVGLETFAPTQAASQQEPSLHLCGETSVQVPRPFTIAFGSRAGAGSIVAGLVPRDPSHVDHQNALAPTSIVAFSSTGCPAHLVVPPSHDPSMSWLLLQDSSAASVVEVREKGARISLQYWRGESGTLRKAGPPLELNCEPLGTMDVETLQSTDRLEFFLPCMSASDGYGGRVLEATSSGLRVARLLPYRFFISYGALVRGKFGGVGLVFIGIDRRARHKGAAHLYYLSVSEKDAQPVLLAVSGQDFKPNMLRVAGEVNGRVAVAFSIVRSSGQEWCAVLIEVPSQSKPSEARCARSEWLASAVTSPASSFPAIAGVRQRQSKGDVEYCVDIAHIDRSSIRTEQLTCRTAPILGLAFASGGGSRMTLSLLDDRRQHSFATVPITKRERARRPL
jgi:hypothetical protein